MKSVYLSLSEIVHELRLLSNSKETGSFYIVSDDQHSATFGFEQGRLVFLQCRLRFGEKAIPLISKIKRGTCRFEGTANFIRKTDFTDNEEVFQQILSTRDQAISGPQSPSSESAMQVPESFANQHRLVLSVEQKMAIEDLLIEELGPIGSLLLETIEQCADFDAIAEVIHDEVEETDIAKLLNRNIRSILRGSVRMR
jgi:hypothetical protein